MAMGIANLVAYWIVFSHLGYLRQYPKMLFFFRLIILYAAYSVGHMIMDGFSMSASIDLMKSVSSMFLFFVFYLSYQRNPRITWKCLKIIIPISILHSIYLFNFQQAFARKIGYDGDLDSNYGAAIAAAIVYPLCVQNKKYSLYLYILMMLFVFYCGQRSGILLAILSLPVAYKNYIKVLRKTDVIATILVCSFSLVPIAIKSYDNLMSRMEKEKDLGSYGSGRSDFYPVAWESYCSGTGMQLMFGRSIEDLKDIIERKVGARITAHNGWLDTIYEYGFFGLLIYLSVFVSLYRRGKDVKMFTPENYNVYVYMIIALLIKNSVTHGAIPDAYAIVWSYIIYNSNAKAKQLYNRV